MKSNRNNTNSIFILFLIKLILSITFIYASYHKIADPAGFAKILYGYAIFPGFSINILAITIPFIELTAGFCLLFGLFPRSALLIINALLSGFVFSIGFNLLRGHTFACGCFSSSSQDVSGGYTLIRNFIFLLLGIYMWIKTKAKAS